MAAVFVGLFCGAAAQAVQSEEAEKVYTSLDSIQQLSEVSITADASQRAVVPVQQLTGAELQRLSVHSVADAMRYFAGVQIKDYGGIGGLKTINVRSLGTNHTGVFYDGVQLGNAQNGQIDLGRFSLDNMEAVQLYNGQKSTIHQTAKDYASASAVYMQTRKPIFANGRSDNLSVSLKGGSFSTVNPSILWEHQFSPRLSGQVSAEYMYTSGKYRFHYAKKNGYDTTETRRNGDIRAVRAEVGLFGTIDRGEWRTKIYFYNSERGYPGAAVREEPGKFSHQDRQWDNSLFGQGTFRKQFSDRYGLLVNLKASYDYLHYLSDPRLDVTTMYTDNRYRQTEVYVSASHLFAITDWWSVSLADDVQYNHLNADLTNFVYPTRWSVLTAVATSVQWRNVSAQASLLHTFASDHTREVGGSAGDQSKFTPTFVVGYTPNKEWSVRAFYKRIFRLPTFNDLYYTFIGNKDLKPEYTTQVDVGFTFDKPVRAGILQSVSVQADGYFNRVEDKIIAMPTSNQFRWTMLNFGLCHIWGVDASVRANWEVGQTALTTHLSYTFNRAMDHTDKSSEFYGGQLPYIPRHSGSAVVSATWRDWTANYSFIYTGERYESSANIPENYSKPWYTSDLSLSYAFPAGVLRCRVTAEVNNLFNQQYEVVQCYPMPGTNFKIKVDITI